MNNRQTQKTPAKVSPLMVRLDADQTILLSPDEQLAFWQALQASTKLTPAQKKLGRIMRGERSVS